MDPLAIASELVAIPSVSLKSNAEASDVVERVLVALDFETERLDYRDVNGELKVNIIGRRGPATSGGIAYFAHTDVVPADTWSINEHSAFEPTVRDGRLFGRGSCDMKGSIGSFLGAVAQVPRERQTRPIYVIATSDEEIGFHGARTVVERSEIYAEAAHGQARGIVGEPTEMEVVYAHKGGYGFRATSHGRAAHSSTREGLNANLAMIPFLQEMKQIHDETIADPAWLNTEFEPPWISWNIGVNDLTAAINITAPQSICTVGFRPMPGQQPKQLMDRAAAAAARCGIAFEILWELPPLYTDPRSSFIAELLEIAEQPAARSVAFGTDGSLYSAFHHLAVIGPGSVRQAHTDDEWLSLDQLYRGAVLYQKMIRRWCVGA